MSVPHTRLIRQWIQETLRHYASGTLAVPSESLLIRDGVYCGHRFRHGNYEAIWFVEEAELKVFGPSGVLLDRLPITDLAMGREKQAA